MIFHVNQTGVIRRAISLLVMLFLLNACGSHLYHVVERGETLYSIGWMYGYDYRQLAKWNGIRAPYALNPGQRLRVSPPSGQQLPPLQAYRSGDVAKRTGTPAARAAPVVAPVKDVKAADDKIKTAPVVEHSAQSVVEAAKKAAQKLFTFKSADWRWPTKQRRILRTFSAKDPARQGLDIAGQDGSPILAAAAGRVVYAGSGLVHYGRLIIVKHSETFLSAYAHNSKLLVKEGEAVNAGQAIAYMGHTGNPIVNDRAVLHFEIRHNGEPVDPMRYLPQ